MLGLPPAFVLSQDQTLKLKPRIRYGVSLTSNLRTSAPDQVRGQSLSVPSRRSNPAKTVKLTPASSGQNPNRPICSRSAVETTKPPAYPFIFHQCQRAQRQKSTGNTTHMAQPTNAVSRFPSASVTANPRNRPPRVPAEPSLPVNRYLGKPSNSRKKKKTGI